MATPHPPARHPTKPEDLRAVLLAEYAAMRSEIGTFQSLQGVFLNMSLVLVGACIAVAANTALSQETAAYASWAAIPFEILALLYADASARLMRAARYIHLKLRPELEKLAGPCLEWEYYLRRKHPGRRLTWCLDKLRWLFFLGPGAVLTCVAFVTQKGPPGLCWADVAMLVLCLAVLVYVFEWVGRKIVRS
jgi:hypothetical protein